jgi:hypothetical protein
MRISFNVETSDGQKNTVTTAYADVMALEDKYDIDASDLVKRQRASWMAYLCWHAMKRQGLTTASFDDWKVTLELLDTEDETGKA